MRYWGKRRDDLLMLATIHEDTWKVLNMQHINPNLKRCDYSDIPGGGVWKIKGPAYLVDGSHHLKDLNPHLLRKKDLLHQEITMLWLPYLLRNNPHIKVHWLHEQLCDMRIEFSNLFNHSSLLVKVVIMICFWPGQFELLNNWYLEELSTFSILDFFVLVINK